MRHAFREESHAVILPRLRRCRGSRRSGVQPATPTPCSQGKLTARFPHPALRETKRVPPCPHRAQRQMVRIGAEFGGRAMVGLRVGQGWWASRD